MTFLLWLAGVLLNGLAFYLLRLALEPFWPGFQACFTTLITEWGAECIFEPDLFQGVTGAQVAVAAVALLITYSLGRLDSVTRSSLRPLIQLNQAISLVVMLLAFLWLILSIVNALTGWRINVPR